MKHLFVVNPVAGKQKPEEKIKLIHDSADRVPGGLAGGFEIYVTRAPMDAVEKIRSAAEGEDDLRVYACGGDGTLNECVNGAAGLKNVAVTHFPCGTGNDFIKMFGADKSRFFDLAELANGEVRPLDLIKCNGRYSINICSMGLDARVGTDVHKYSGLPLLGGPAGYVASLAVNFVKGVSQPMTVTADGLTCGPRLNLVCICNGRFYGGGFTQLGVQALGIVSVAAYVLIVMFIVFKVIDKTVGLRVPAQIEIDGLDMHEHGLASAYSGFAINDMTGMDMDVNENTDLGEDDYEKASKAQVDAAVKVVNKKTIVDGVYDTGMHKVSIICRLSKFDALKTSLNELGVTGITMTQVMGCGIQKGAGEKYRGVELDANLIPKVKVEVVVSKIPVDSVIEAAKKALYTGHIGDGKIFVYNVTKVVKVRTGEEDFAALQDVE